MRDFQGISTYLIIILLQLDSIAKSHLLEMLLLLFLLSQVSGGEGKAEINIE